MDDIEESTEMSDSLEVSDEIKKYLAAIAKWTKFISIMGFISIGSMLLIAMIMIINGHNVNGASQMYALLFVILAVIYFFPVNYLYKSSNHLKQAVNLNDQSFLTSGFENLKSHFKYLSFLMIISLSGYVVMSIIMVMVNMLY